MFSFGTWKVMTGRVWIFKNNSPLGGRSGLFFFISTQCLYYVLSSLILTFCKYFWISLLTVWRMRRIRSHLILSETMQISPRFPLPRSHHLIVPVPVTTLRWISIWLHIELVCCWAGVRFMLDTSVLSEPPGRHTHTCPLCPHWSPELDTGSLPKWDNGNYRTLTNVSSYQKLQTHTLKKDMFHCRLDFVPQKMEWESICQMKLEISDDFYLFVVRKF